jgi:cytochrome c556
MLMMNFRFLPAPLTLALLCAGAKFTYAQAEKEAGVKTAMRQKVAYSQQVLVGITLEDYGLIAKNADKLVELSNKTNWYSRQVPQYELFLNEFRRNAQGLMEAAQKKDVDAASLAYVQMTLSCVSCHKFIRQSSGTGSILDFRPMLYVGNSKP